MTDIHILDQLFAGADDYVGQFIDRYRKADAEVGETQNLSLLTATAADLGDDLAPLFAAAIRRLARKAP